MPQVMTVEDGTHDETGDFSTQYTDEEFIDAVRKHEPASTKMIADEVGCADKTAYYRLKDKLMPEGKVHGEQPGREWIWSVPKEDAERVIDALETDKGVATTAAIADDTGMGEEKTEELLYELREQGVVASEKIPRKDGLIWYLPDE